MHLFILDSLYSFLPCANLSLSPLLRKRSGLLGSRLTALRVLPSVQVWFELVQAHSQYPGTPLWFQARNCSGKHRLVVKGYDSLEGAGCGH